MEIDELELQTGFDFNDINNTEIKINPDYYIHTALLMAQKTLLFSVAKTSITEGLLAYNIFVEHIEMLCKAAGHITDDYDKQIQDFKETDEYKQHDNRKDIQLTKLANKKLNLLMKEVFSRAPLKSPLRI